MVSMPEMMKRLSGLYVVNKKVQLSYFSIWTENCEQQLVGPGSAFINETSQSG